MKFDLKFDNSDILEIGSIFCIGSNYSKHIREMGGVKPENPVIFLKPRAAYLENGGTIKIPEFSNLCHHELELVVIIGEHCSNINKNDAYKYIAGYAVGIDVTLRDIQNIAKQKGQPWAVAKGFVTSAPISMVVSSSHFNNQIPYFDLLLSVNGELRQKANTSEMERSVAELIEYLSKVFTLNRGDCIFTGTPEGVGQIKSGDKLLAELVGFTKLEINVE
ncbi:MAG: fumarylacetoacetate hydrolase family protein [Candidatus Kapabacteria bacterium]|nr:fumarylacetoacetate hydrolase family protein [Candidatus Kapabacteria bacterium]